MTAAARRKLMEINEQLFVSNSFDAHKFHLNASSSLASQQAVRSTSVFPFTLSTILGWSRSLKTLNYIVMRERCQPIIFDVSLTVYC